MALYLGSSDKLKINAIDGGIYHIIIPSFPTIVNGIMLLSSDNFILKDSNGIYLTSKEDE